MRRTEHKKTEVERIRSKNYAPASKGWNAPAEGNRGPIEKNACPGEGSEPNEDRKVPICPATGAKMKAAKCSAIISQPVSHKVEMGA